ncbi:sensor histidine kinase [Bradyrhizobium sp. STM 3809]|uniref:sensor histidine kinase n=1 Tax=Bradyrhizobium sp. STM 3809 TaxID=551936 RepID=UPI000240A7A2|nr:sensor histidine kinase [Bradyrhizobium sp. STM 3809]CCD98626.1 Signal transduction histidine kinase [Bradyrhizobium sp. STM 3809]
MNLEDLYRLLRTSHVQAQGIVDTINEPLLVLDEKACVIDANRAFFATFLVERDDTIGTSLYSLGNGQWNIPRLRSLVSEIIPRSTAVVDYEVTHTFPAIGTRTFLLTARRLWKPDDNSTHVLLVFTDVTQRRAREHESSLLFSELRHRMRNLLGVIRAIANQTETTGKTAQDYKTVFMGRLEALMAAQSLMIAGSADIDLASLVTKVVGGLGADRLVQHGGPAVAIAQKQVIPLTMILHEFATNALKYGAFGERGGTVEISWQLSGGTSEPQTLLLSWQERCDRPIVKPTRQGTGTSIIENGAKLALQGSAQLTFDSQGLTARLRIPVASAHEHE